MSSIVFCGLSCSTILHISNGTIFGNKVVEHIICVLVFSATLSWKSLILRVHWDIVNVRWSSCKVPVRYSCQILMKLEFSQQSFYIFSKRFSKIFHENPSRVSRVVSCGRTEKQTCQSQQSLFAVSGTRLMNETQDGQVQFTQILGRHFTKMLKLQPGLDSQCNVW